MPITLCSFAKINLGLVIGPKRADGFHELRTVYQTISLHDTIRVDVKAGTGIEVRSRDARVPQDETNTCYRVADRVMKSLKRRGRVVITIEKNLPVQGGLGAGSSNAVATLLALERLLKEELPPPERLRVTCEVGSDLPLFLVGGTVLGVGRGEQVFPLADMPQANVVVVAPNKGVSTPEAFSAWDGYAAKEFAAGRNGSSALTDDALSDRMSAFSQSVFSWLRPTAGVPTKSGGRVETPLLDLVRAGIENDFERVVFSLYPELRGWKRALEREGAQYASLSGSGSALYGLFDSAKDAESAAAKISSEGVTAFAAQTLTRSEYWGRIFE